MRLFAEPSVDRTGRTHATFFVSGVRHRSLSDPQVEAALARLEQGDRLTLVPEPTNLEDPLAQLVAEDAGVPVGWVPRVLLPHVRVVQAVAEPTVTVTTVHGPDVVPAFRLLVSLDGVAQRGYRPFSGPDWRPASTHIE